MEHLIGIDQDPSSHSIARPRLETAAGPLLQIHQEIGNFRRAYTLPDSSRGLLLLLPLPALPLGRALSQGPKPQK